MVGSQFGAGLGATLIPVIGPFAVVSIRQIVAAIALLVIGRPRLRGRGFTELLPAIVLGLVMGVMNNAVYLSIERIGVGLTVTLEFLGPLTVALLGSRKLLDIACALAAAGGVALLISGPVRLDGMGIVFGLVGAAAWGTYIVLNQRIGRTFEGLQGSAIAATVSAVVFAPLGLLTLNGRMPDLHVLLLGTCAGILSSAIPFAIDMFALRRIARPLFGLLMSVNPALAALAGLVVLGQQLTVPQWIALALISLASAVALTRSVRGATPAPGDDVP